MNKKIVKKALGVCTLLVLSFFAGGFAARLETFFEKPEAVPTSANIKYYANIVSEKALLRRLIKTTEEVANSCYLEKENTETLLEEAEMPLIILKKLPS